MLRKNALVALMTVFILLVTYQMVLSNNAPDTEPIVTPSRISLTLSPGESHDEQIHVFTGDNPINKADVMFVFDRTGSMDGEIAAAKASALEIMNTVQDSVPTTWFGVAGFMDYPSTYSYPGYSATYGSAASGDVPWELNIQPTNNIIDVAAAVNSLTLGYGADSPESYTRALHELTSINWRLNSKKLAIIYGDAPTHDLDFAGYNYGGDPGLDATAQTSDDLDFETTVQEIADADITIIGVNSGASTGPEAATFQGMSIGYGTLPGTSGQYFLLSQATQIPTVTVQLILSETQHIDQLSLQVTEGYETWVDITPDMYTDVGTNITKTFNLNITVPAGTESGFYPFLVQAIADSSILGLTYVDITVPAASPTNDIGFRPDNDGFGFANESSDGNWEMFRQFFGTDQVEYPNGDRLLAADNFYQNYYKDAGSGGSCDGFSSTSLINYQDLTQPNAGEFTMPNYSPLYVQNNNNDIREAFAFAQRIQMGMEYQFHNQTMCTLLGNSSEGFYHYLKSQIENGSAATVGIRWDEDIYTLGLKVLEAGGGHALVPYRFEEPTSSTAYVYVYDSNRPGDNNRRIEFDLDDDTWSYKYHIPLLPDPTIEGNSSTCNLTVTPIDIYRHQGVAWWVFEGTSASSFQGTENAGKLFSTNGPARLLVTDDENRRLGWDGIEFYDEIPNATYSGVLLENGNTSSGMYYIPDEITYKLELHSYGMGQGGITMINDGYLVELSDMLLITGTTASLSIAADGSSLTISESNDEIQGTLTVNPVLATDDRSVSIGGIIVYPGDVVTLEFDAFSITSGMTDMVKIETNATAVQTYTISLQRAGGVGYSAFGTANIPLAPNSSALLYIEDWSNLTGLEILVDLDDDGDIDIINPIVNQSQVAAVIVEASKTEALTGGDQVNLIVEVRDQFGAFIANGTLVNLSTTLGTLSTNQAVTSGGLVYLTLTTADEEGTAVITANANGIVGQVEVIIINPTFESYLPLVYTVAP